MKKRLVGVALVLAAVSLGSIQPVEACTRAVYIGPDQMVITGRTMDWKEDIMTNIYVFPRGIQRAGHNKDKTVNWTAKYGSVIATGYDIGTCDGMNEKGLVASLLFYRQQILHPTAHRSQNEQPSGKHVPRHLSGLPLLLQFRDAER